tara:strand:- start:6314 stop:6643 length:330 start_codon:yes stop_codon:yes gene_type:complete
MTDFLKNNKRRFIMIGVLITIYLGVIVIDLIAKKVLFENIAHDKGATKITLRHFVQPKENIFLHPEQFKQFLDRIVKGKDGILSWQPFYVILLFLYIGLALALFWKLSK